MARKRPGTSGAGKQTNFLTDSVVALAEYGKKALINAEEFGIENKPLAHFRPSLAQRDVLLLAPSLSKPIRRKLMKEASSFTVAEVAGMTMALAEDLMDGNAPKRTAMILVGKYLLERLQEEIVGPAKPSQSKVRKSKQMADAKALYQFKITLLESQLPIWRRIQVPDCTLDKLHEHIQTAMGWTNSHLHHFKIGEQRYGDPLLMEEDMEEFGYKDSTTTMLSDIVPRGGKGFRLRYEYDFGDSWEHEVLFEGCPMAEAGRHYPLCLEGERACPPEDCGGVWGYAEFLKAIGDKNHERHEEFMDWVGRRFDSEEFDPVTATKNMKKGLPD